MSDSDAVSKTVSTLQSAYNLAKGIADLNEAHAIKAQIGELQAQILSAQEGTLRSQERESTLTRRVHELEQRIAHMETWDREKERYQLTELPPGVFVYAVKEEERRDEPPHKLCANCFQEGRKSFLNSDETINGTTRLHCPSCGFEDRVGHFRAPPIERDGGDWMSR